MIHSAMCAFRRPLAVATLGAGGTLAGQAHPAMAHVWVGFGFPAGRRSAGLQPACAIPSVRSVVRGQRDGVPDGTPGRVPLGVPLHDDAGPSLGQRRLMATPPGIRPPEGAKDNPREQVPPANAPQYAARIEDYALIGDCHSAALVSREGSIDWLCWPRFDSPACFAALVGTPDNGRWRIAPAEAPVSIRRQYRPGTLILETIFETQDGSVALIDFMTAATGNSSVVRIVEGRSGQVAMRLDLALRFDYGSAIPWVTQLAARHWPARHRWARTSWCCTAACSFAARSSPRSANSPSRPANAFRSP